MMVELPETVAVAFEVLADKYGVDPERAEKLKKEGYKLYIATNGYPEFQYARIKAAKLKNLFDGIFISEEMGADKPSIEYFDRCFARIKDFDREKTMIVGDSLTSDILGGNNAGIATCWVNPQHKPRRSDIRVDHEIESITQLSALLEGL